MEIARSNGQFKQGKKKDILVKAIVWIEEVHAHVLLFAYKIKIEKYTVF